MVYILHVCVYSSVHVSVHTYIRVYVHVYIYNIWVANMQGHPLYLERHHNISHICMYTSKCHSLSSSYMYGMSKMMINHPSSLLKALCHINEHNNSLKADKIQKYSLQSECDICII